MPIAELAAGLAEDLLHVVIFGPGYGEAVAVRIPGGDWLVCDSLSGTGRRADFVPIAELLGQRGESASVLILTHPHDDHVAGFDRLVTRFASGLVGTVSVHMPPDDFTEEDFATGVLAHSNRLKAIAAIQRYWRLHPEYKWLITADGSTQRFGPGTIEVLHPDAQYLSAGTPDPGKSPNAYSTPVLICWERVRIVLGADLPKEQWDELGRAPRKPPVSLHGALKVPHHGSRGALSEALVAAGDPSPLAHIAPWHKGRGLLPKLGAEGGLSWLLKRREEVGLTATGRAHNGVVPHPIAEAALLASAQRRTLPGTSAEIEMKQSYDPDESWIASSFGRDGAVQSVAYGRDARLVKRD